MPKTVQIRNVPDHVHKTVRARADRAGVSVSDYLRALITELALHPTIADIMERPEAMVHPDSGTRPESAAAGGARTPVPRRS
jgi:hypothetical protein